MPIRFAASPRLPVIVTHSLAKSPNVPHAQQPEVTQPYRCSPKERLGQHHFHSSQLPTHLSKATLSCPRFHTVAATSLPNFHCIEIAAIVAGIPDMAGKCVYFVVLRTIHPRSCCNVCAVLGIFFMPNRHISGFVDITKQQNCWGEVHKPRDSPHLRDHFIQPVDPFEICDTHAASGYLNVLCRFGSSWSHMPPTH